MPAMAKPCCLNIAHLYLILLVIQMFNRLCKLSLFSGGDRNNYLRSMICETFDHQEAFITESNTTPQYFANLLLIQGEKTKVVRAQMDSASTCNSIPSSILRKLCSTLLLSGFVLDSPEFNYSTALCK